MLIRMWEKEKSYSLLVSVQADGVSMEISIGVLQKAINEIIINPIPFLDTYAKDSVPTVETLSQSRSLLLCS